MHWFLIMNHYSMNMNIIVPINYDIVNGWKENSVQPTLAHFTVSQFEGKNQYSLKITR